MTYRPPSALYDRFSRLLRLGLDPRLSDDEREDALRALSGSTKDLTELFDDPAFGNLITALSAPYQVEEAPKDAKHSGQPIEVRCGLGAYKVAADLRQLIHESFDHNWYVVGPEIEDQVRTSDRAIVCARAVGAADLASTDDLARGAAWTQLVSGNGLLAIWQARPEDAAGLAAYLRHSLELGASRTSLPRSLALVITRELASRPRAKDWFDGIARWLEAWVVAVPLEGRTPADTARLLRHTRLMMRVGLAMRATEVRSPRLLALAELVSVVTLLRAAGRGDLMRAHSEAHGDPMETVRAHERHDRRADLRFETAIGAVLRSPSVAELAGLAEHEQRALMGVGDVLRADPGLSQGLLANPR